MNKGFTVIELVTTFALTAVIVVVLINVGLVIRNIYNKFDSRTELLIEQANLSRAMNSKINHDNLINYEACVESSFCYDFSFKDGTNIRLLVTNDLILFGDYTYKLDNNSEVSEPEITKVSANVDTVSDNNKFLVIKIPIVNKLYKNEDFGINLIYPYNSNKIDL